MSTFKFALKVVGLIVVFGIAALFIGAGISTVISTNSYDPSSFSETLGEEDLPQQNGTDAAMTPPATFKPTKAQENALASAEQYLSFSGFSKAGLMRQLTSSAGEGFDKKDAKWALNRVEVDWNEEAVQTAKTYQEIMPMSRAGLIRQMTSSVGDQFTKAQAEYAADKVGL